MDWMGKAALTAVTVAFVLALARRLGGRCAGVAAAWPWTTAPALVWLADAHGAAAAARAAAASVGAGAVLAAFALAYGAAAAGGLRVRAALGVAWAGALLAAAPACLLAGSLSASLALAALAAWLAARHLPRSHGGGAGAAPRPGARAVLATALVAGATGALVAALEPRLGGAAVGLLASLPVSGAAVAATAHACGGAAGAQGFLRGYVTGLAGRALFGATFALAVAPCGAGMAAVIALLASAAPAALSSRRGGPVRAPAVQA